MTPTLMTDEERLSLALTKRKDIEQNLRDAELLVQLCKKHLDVVDSSIRYLQEIDVIPRTEQVKPLRHHSTERKRKPRRPSINEEQVQRILTGWDEGKTRYRIYKEIGCAYVTVCRIVKKFRQNEDATAGAAASVL